MKINLKYFYATVLTFLFNVWAFAGLDDGGGDTPPTPGPPENVGSPASPIDMYIPVLILAAVVFAIWYVRRNRLKNA
ncbi:hypothetical protein AAH994_11660 [Weeksellaceae bacterium A-14]